ncbi:MAG: luxQ [Bryobacterales bacterium]|nr:luxQ [Bryobacterales bacterium]
MSETNVTAGEPLAASESFSIVGIGASAGGLEACSTLLKHLPPDTGLAFVVVQHLDPSHQSLLTTLLARATRIPVQEVSDGMVVGPNKVYVMPPNVDMVLSAGTLHLTPREKVRDGQRMPINTFLRSLAEDCRHRAIGVILSGTGSDGALGLDTIKAEGGFTFAQDTQSAKFQDMPVNAVATGSVDFVLHPEGIAQELIRIAKSPYAGRSEGSSSGGQATDVAAAFQDIFKSLHAACGVDYSQYRSSTIQRRIFRRMALNHVSDPGRYAEFLKGNPGEIALLCEEMIPRVTKFFRDPDTFEALKKEVFPRLVENRRSETPIRIWVPGCASGEEAYAIAICLLEFLKDPGSIFPIQIFGTDVSMIAVQKARQGVYPAKISEDVSPERLERFFDQREDGYQINKSVRSTCIFAAHDLLNDPPYSNLDLISCRNVLIYLDSVQTRVVPMFHYALKPTGFLMLGVAESVKRFADFFLLVEKSSQIHSKKAVDRHHLLSWGPAKIPSLAKARRPADVWEDADLRKRADHIIMAKYSPDGVVVNGNLQVVQVRGQISPYLEPAAGKMSVNILAMAKRSGLAFDLETAITQAKKEKTAVRREGLAIAQSGRIIDLDVIPLGAQENDESFLILFGERPPAASVARSEMVENPLVPQSEYQQLKRDLAAARDRLSAVLDNHQQYTDDTQSAQEESMSNLEEVQSVNEELETAKEELQSTNEELSTVNEELQALNINLQQSRDFTTSIVETVREPLVVLDSEQMVRMANAAFYRTFGLTKRDTEGRSIYELANRAWDSPDLRRMLGEVLSANRAVDNFELERDFLHVGRKSLLINACRLNGGEMVLLSIEDATVRKLGERNLRQAEEELRQGQKMEAIGRLAGGVAHDFNNLLTGILGYSDLLLESIGGGSEAYHQADEIKKAAERAAELTHQLLAFSRRQILRPQVLNLNAIILDLDKMLRRLIGADIDLVTATDAELETVYADSGQIGQVILNLALNARDAMPRGGMLSIGTANTVVNGAGGGTRGLAAGRYVTLQVADTGTGMDPETQAHLFEPFYTTKAQGSGTGLGLATVYGIVEQSGGHIHFTSSPHGGTVFWIDFPVARAPQVRGQPLVRDQMPRGSEVVLIVEDEEMVRRLAVHLLRRQGYTVLEAGDGVQGLSICRAHPSGINLLLTDMVMPGGLNGRELIEQAIAIRPDLKTLLMSGHTTDSLVHLGVKHGSAFLQKPFRIRELALKVREVLDRKDMT